MPTVNIHKDCTVTIYAGGADDGTYTEGSSDTFACDEVQWTDSDMADPHGTAQDAIEMHRGGKRDPSMRISTKLADATTLGIVQGNEVLKVVVSAPTGFGVTFVGRRGEWSATYGHPSTLELELKSYGVAPTYA